MKKFPKIEDVVNYLANGASVSALVINNNTAQIIEGVGEIEINNIEYQIQVLLEPRKNYFATEEKQVTVRIIEEDSLSENLNHSEKKSLSDFINSDEEQIHRAIISYIIPESQKTKFTQKEFYEMIIDALQHELKFIDEED